LQLVRPYQTLGKPIGIPHTRIGLAGPKRPEGRYGNGSPGGLSGSEAA
jgi:hypothetical protein